MQGAAAQQLWSILFLSKSNLPGCLHAGRTVAVQGLALHLTCLMIAWMFSLGCSSWKASSVLSYNTVVWRSAASSILIATRDKLLLATLLATTQARKV
jgi:hypothetical protein